MTTPGLRQLMFTDSFFCEDRPLSYKVLHKGK
jgi:hypothetical protein